MKEPVGRAAFIRSSVSFIDKKMMASKYTEMRGAWHVFICWFSGDSLGQERCRPGTGRLDHGAPHALGAEGLSSTHDQGDVWQPLQDQLSVAGPRAFVESLEDKTKVFCMCFVLLRLPENSG